MSNPKKFVVKSIDELTEGKEINMYDFQVSSYDSKTGISKIVNMEFIIDESKEGFVNFELQPGYWTVTSKSQMLKLDADEERYFMTETANKLIHHFQQFVKKLDIYKKLELPSKRSFLFSSEPGCGKSSLIRYFVREFLKDEKACAIRLDTEEIPWNSLTQAFSLAKEENVSKILMIIEDIGGSNLSERRTHIDTQMLNFLDGNASIFKIPTIIVATTNFLDMLDNTLTDRPGRFDLIEHVLPPSDDEVLMIVEGLIKRPLTDKEKKCLKGKEFTPAYCKEAVIRSELYDIDIGEAVDQLVDQRKKSQSKDVASKRRRAGFADD